MVLRPKIVRTHTHARTHTHPQRVYIYISFLLTLVYGARYTILEQKKSCLYERFNPTNHGFLMHYTQFGNSWETKKIILFGIQLMIINLAI